MLRMPSTKEELERMDLNILAVFCQKVAEARSDNSTEAHQARQLKHEWTLLLDPRTPSSRLPGPQVDNQAEQLKGRMVSFLSGVFAAR
jgi:hypothetical protein